ncbi:MAG: hypothetical protein PsegKO_22600 [Pseudohongiellaceae bacterium]
MEQLLEEVEQSNDAEPRMRSEELINSLNSEHEKALAAQSEVFDSQLDILAATGGYDAY